jgi:hypothetical protein
MPTSEIFDFDTGDMDYREEKATDALLSHPAIYINHLEMARRLIVWTDRARKLDMGGIEFTNGFCRGLEEVAAFLRQGDFVPDSTFLAEGRESEEDPSDSLLPSHRKSHGSAGSEQGTNGTRPT